MLYYTHDYLIDIKKVGAMQYFSNNDEMVKNITMIVGSVILYLKQLVIQPNRYYCGIDKHRCGQIIFRNLDTKKQTTKCQYVKFKCVKSITYFSLYG